MARGALLAIMLLGTALRLYDLGADSFWVDEIITGSLIRMKLPVMLDVISKYDDHPPLFYLIVRVSALLGSSDFAVRLPAAFAGILCIPLMYTLGNRLIGKPAGPLASMLVAVWPAHLHYSQEARQYTLLALFALASIYWLDRGTIKSSTRSWTGYVIATSAAMYTHYFAFLLLAAQAVFVGIAGLITLVNAAPARRRRYLSPRLLFFMLSVLLCLLAYAPWYPSLLTQSKRLIGNAQSPFTRFTAVGTYVQTAQQTLQFMGENQRTLVIALVVAMLVGLAIGAVKRRWMATIYILTYLIVPIIGVTAISSSHFFHPRYLFPLFAPILLLVAQGLTLIGEGASVSFRQHPRWKSIVWAATLVLLPVLLAPVDVAYYKTQKEDWHRAADYLISQKKPQDVILGDGVFGGGGGGDALRVEQGVGYYLNDPAAVLKAEPGLVDRLPPDHSASGTAWGVIWYQGQLADRKFLESTISFTDFKDVLVFSLKQPSGQVWADTAAVLEAMLKLQPLPETHLDLDLALAELYLLTGDTRLATLHTNAAAEKVSLGDQRLAEVLTKIREQLVKEK